MGGMRSAADVSKMSEEANEPLADELVQKAVGAAHTCLPQGLAQLVLRSKAECNSSSPTVMLQASAEGAPAADHLPEGQLRQRLVTLVALPPGDQVPGKQVSQFSPPDPGGHPTRDTAAAAAAAMAASVR
jgi:hypothetical protein